VIRPSRLAHGALLLVGIAVFAVLVRRIGAAQLIADLRSFGWAILGVVALELVIDACNTVAWRLTLPPDAPIGFGRLYWVRQAGVAINQITPTATVGGEVAKTVLLRPYLRTATTAASLVAARMSYALGQAALVLLGLSTVLARTRDTPDLGIAIVVALMATIAGVLAFVWLQGRGFFATASRAIGRLGLASEIVERLHAGGAALDAQLSTLYRERPGAFAASVGCVALIAGAAYAVTVLEWVMPASNLQLGYAAALDFSIKTAEMSGLDAQAQDIQAQSAETPDGQTKPVSGAQAAAAAEPEHSGGIRLGGNVIEQPATTRKISSVYGLFTVSDGKSIQRFPYSIVPDMFDVSLAGSEGLDFCWIYVDPDNGGAVPSELERQR